MVKFKCEYYYQINLKFFLLFSFLLSVMVLTLNVEKIEKIENAKISIFEPQFQENFIPNPSYNKLSDNKSEIRIIEPKICMMKKTF